VSLWGKSLGFLGWNFWNNQVKLWLIALATALTILIVLRIVRRILIRSFSKRAQRSGNDLYELTTVSARRTQMPLVAILALYAGLQVLTLPQGLKPWIVSVAMAALIVQLTIWANAMLGFFIGRYQQTHIENQASRAATLRAVNFVARILLIGIAVILILDNIPGVEITALIASLGIGGIAVALALQNILSDLFGSLSIMLDKPFVVDDFIIVDNYLGTVEYIGLKTTRVRSLSGEQLVFSNNDLLKSRIRNFKRMAERRVVFTIGVTYQTPVAKLKKIPELIENFIQSLEATRFDRAHFQGFGDFALNFEVVYYVLDPDYNRYMDIQQAINLALFEKFSHLGISFAYPTQTLYIDRSSRPVAPLSSDADARE
jgi:small-conductance mechanosensitive channel